MSEIDFWEALAEGGNPIAKRNLEEFKTGERRTTNDEAQCTMHNERSTTNEAQRTMHNERSTMHDEQCTTNEVQRTMHDARCTLNTEH